MSCHPPAVVMYLFYTYAILIKILHTDDPYYIIFPGIVVAITINFVYLPSVTAKRGCKQNEDDYY